MYVGAEFVEGGDEGGGYIGETAGFGGELVGHVAHTLWEIGYLGRDDENPGIRRVFIFALHGLLVLFFLQKN